MTRPLDLAAVDQELARLREMIPETYPNLSNVLADEYLVGAAARLAIAVMALDLRITVEHEPDRFPYTLAAWIEMTAAVAGGEQPQ